MTRAHPAATAPEALDRHARQSIMAPAAALHGAGEPLQSAAGRRQLPRVQSLSAPPAIATTYVT